AAPIRTALITTTRAFGTSATSTAATRSTPSTAPPSAPRKASAASSCHSPPPPKSGRTRRSAPSSPSRTERLTRGLDHLRASGASRAQALARNEQSNRAGDMLGADGFASAFERGAGKSSGKSLARAYH